MRARAPATSVGEARSPETSDLRRELMETIWWVGEALELELELEAGSVAIAAASEGGMRLKLSAMIPVLCRLQGARVAQIESFGYVIVQFDIELGNPHENHTFF